MIDLRLGDCLDLMPTLPDESIDAVIADIPYGTTACSWDTVIPFAPMWEQLKRLAKRKAAIVLFGSQPFTSALVMSNPKMFRYEWVWQKEKGTGHLDANRKPLKAHENIVVFSEDGHLYNPQFRKGASYTHSASRGRRAHVYQPFGAVETRNSGMRYPITIVNVRSDSQFGESYHPTQKPVALMEYLIRTYTNEGDTVLDFTMGSGTTMVGCVNTNRNGIGFELREDYFEIAQRRVNEAQLQMPLEMVGA